MSNNYRNLVYAISGQPVFPQYYEHHQTPTPRERTVREDLEAAARMLEEQEKQQSAGNPIINGVKCATSSYAHGVTYGTSDEIGGMAGAAVGTIIDALQGKSSLKNSEEYYTSVRDDFRNYRKECENQYPATTTIAEIAGLMSNPYTFAKATSTAPRSVILKKEGVNNIIAGGAYGLGIGEGNWDEQAMKAI